MKNERHQKILQLITDQTIETQDELAAELEKQGYNVTQATVSRDIRELKLTKVSVDGRLKYVAFPDAASVLGDKYVRVLREGFISMDMAQNILVIKTVSGMAMAVAAALDTMEWDEIVGTIAGDDTIMCAIKTVPDTRHLMDKIRNVIDGK